MVNIFRRFQQPLLIALTVIVIISFVVLYNLPSHNGNVAANQVARLYGRGITMAEAQRTARRFEVCLDLRMFEVLQSLYGRARSREEGQENYLWNTLVLRHEAEELGVVPSVAEIEQAITAMPVFQTNNQFDSSKYNMFVQQALAPRGFTASELEEVVADDLRLKRIKEILGSTVSATPSELKEEYTRENQKRILSVVRLNLEEFKKAAQVSEEDVKKLFEQKKDSLKTPEQRKVKYASFSPQSDKPLVGADRMAQMEQLAGQAQAFAETLKKPDAKFEPGVGAKVAETGFFPQTAAPIELENSDEIAQAVFALSKEAPYSDALSGGNGYFVVQLLDTQASRPRTYEEAKAELEDQLRNERASEALQLKATEVRNKIEAELKAGKSFTDAATAAGMKAETLPAYSAREPLPQSPDSFAIMEAGGDLKENGLSNYLPTGQGGILVHADKLLPVDEKAFEEQKTRLAEQINRAKREAVFQEWLRMRAQAANLQKA